MPKLAVTGIHAPYPPQFSEPDGSGSQLPGGTSCGSSDHTLGTWKRRLGLTGKP